MNPAIAELRKFLEERGDELDAIDRLTLENIVLLYDYTFISANLLLDLNTRLQRVEEDAKEFYLQKAANSNES
jgi:hypothetical protein